MAIKVTGNIVITDAQAIANITTISANGNANVGNLGTAQVLATANVTAPQLISNVSTGTAPIVVTSTTVVANLNANALQGNVPAATAVANTIVQRNADANITANFFIGNGSQLTGVSVASISNGTSNVNIATSGGNVTVGVGGTAAVATFTTTGANITGTANITGNANVGNIGAATAELTTGNITTINSGLLQNGNSNITLTAGGNLTFTARTVSTMVVSNTGANITGTANVSGNANVGNIGAAQVLATANVTAPQLISNVVTGTAPFVVTSTTTVSNLSVTSLQGNGPSQTATANSIVQRNVDGNITGNFFIGNGSQLTGLSAGFPLANGTSNINIPTASGNINFSVGGSANEAIVTSTGFVVNGSINATGNITVPVLISNIATGTAPLTVTSTTEVANLNVANASLVTGTTGGQLTSWVNGTIAPDEMANSRMSFGFTSYTNNDASPYADFLLLRSGSSAFFGNDNLLMFNKGVIGMRLWQQTYESNSAFSSYKDVAFTDSNITGYAATVSSAAQPNITSVGTLSGLTVSTTISGSVNGSAATFTSTSQNSQFNSIGVGTAASTTAGEIRATNNITAYYSDDRLKTRLGVIEDAIEKIKKLNGFYYTANELAESLGYTKKLEVGLSAQEMQEVLPEVVTVAPIDDKYLTIWYEKTIPLLVQGIKELANEVDYLKRYINEKFSDTSIK